MPSASETKLSLGVSRHEQGHRSRTPRHRLGHGAVQPSRGAVASFRRHDQQISRGRVQVIDDGPRRKTAGDHELGHLHAELFEDGLARAAVLEQPPAFERASHGRKLPPVRPVVVGADVKDDEPCATQQRNGERMRECALAGRREVGGMNDRLDERWHWYLWASAVLRRAFRCPDCRSEPRRHATGIIGSHWRVESRHCQK